MLLYDTVEEAHMRLGHCVVMSDKHGPLFVNEVYHRNEDGKVGMHCYKLPSLVDKVSVAVDDPDLNWRMFQLGYMNSRKGVYYWSRTPVRGAGYKQGLANSNVYGKSPNGHGTKMTESYKLKAFCDMLTNDYPTFDRCVADVSKEPDPLGDFRLRQAAFHKYFAVVFDEFRKDFNILYKNKPVCWGTPTKGFTVPPNFQHLKEALAEAGVKVLG